MAKHPGIMPSRAALNAALQVVAGLWCECSTSRHGFDGYSVQDDLDECRQEIAKVIDRAIAEVAADVLRRSDG